VDQRGVQKAGLKLSLVEVDMAFLYDSQTIDFLEKEHPYLLNCYFMSFE
jgi:hypothetical protein